MHFCAPTSKTGVLVHLLTRNGFLVPCWVPCGHFIHLFVVFVPPCINHRRLAHCSVLCAAGSSCLVLAHPTRLPGCHMHAPTLYYNTRFGHLTILCALFQSFVACVFTLCLPLTLPCDIVKAESFGELEDPRATGSLVSNLLMWPSEESEFQK